MFLVYREDQEKPNMEFKMHQSGLHCYNPTDKEVVLINTVSGNKQVFPRDKLMVQNKQNIVRQTWLPISYIFQLDC